MNSDRYKQINSYVLTIEEIAVLEKYNINYKSVKYIEEVLYLIDNFLNNSYGDLTDLEEVSISIGDRNYYMNSNK